MKYRYLVNLACKSFAIAAFSAAPAQASDWSVGGAWSLLGQDHVSAEDGAGLEAGEPAIDESSFFALPLMTINEPGLAVRYALPLIGTAVINKDASELAREGTFGSVADGGQFFNIQGAYTKSILGGEVGVFGSVADSNSPFSMETTTSRTIGASLAYAGFYLRGAYQDSSSDGFLDARRAWQAGLGYGSDNFDLRVTYVQSAVLQGRLTELEGKQWMIGGLVPLTPSILLNANAFYIDRQQIVPTLEPPGAGARVGLELRF
ncbi:MAG: porin [Rhodospirillaceae bacterium]